MKSLGLVAALLVLTFPNFVHAQTQTIPADAKKEIDRANAAWVPGLAARNLDQACSGFEPSTLFLADDGSVTRGLTAFKANLQKRFDAGWKVTGGQVIQLGANLVNGKIVEWGSSFLETADRNGVRHRGGGYYLAVWEKDRAGSWKITRNIGLGAGPS